MNKIIKITLVVFFLLISNIVNAVIEPPFKNIIVNEQPIEYKDIIFKDYDGNVVRFWHVPENSRIVICEDSTGTVELTRQAYSL